MDNKVLNFIWSYVEIKFKIIRVILVIFLLPFVLTSSGCESKNNMEFNPADINSSKILSDNSSGYWSNHYFDRDTSIESNGASNLHNDKINKDNLGINESNIKPEIPEKNIDDKKIKASEETETDKLSIIMVGDILLHDGINRCSEYEKGKYDYSPIFKYTKSEINSADIAIVNQEVIIGGKELGITGYPSFNAPYEIGDALAEAGFDIVCHSTNHSLDRGKKGIVNCLDYWESEHPDIDVLGIYLNEEDSENICIYNSNLNGKEIKIAFLNFTYGTNGINTPDQMEWCIDILEVNNVVKKLQKAEREADFTVVLPHWGTEYKLSQSEEQKKWCEIFLENGVDLVIGTHPHVIEPIEMYVDKSTGNKMLVYYSLGNFVNWTSGKGSQIFNRVVGGMAKVDIELDDSNSPVIKDYNVEALVCHLTSGKGGVTVYPLKDYNEKLAEENEIKNQDIDFNKQNCVDLCNEVWGDKWE